VIDTFKPEPESSMESEEPPETTIAFRKIVRNKPQYEVCRLFLATLQLVWVLANLNACFNLVSYQANTYNVHIDVEGELTERMDAMRLTLLNTRRHCDELAEYRAPSVQH
jgi:hypothetical protein